MGKFALLIALNYVNSPKNALKGCVNDSHMIKGMLKKKGFADKNIKLVNDVDRGVMRPTGANVKMMLDWLCTKRKKGDVIVLAYSGHGVSIRDDSFGGDEADGKDEAIVLESGYLLVDEDLKQFVSKLPAGAEFTAIMDCCHSGGLLDGKTVIIGGDKRHDKEEHSREVDVSDERGAHESAREMPVKDLAAILSHKLGKTVSPTRHGIAGAEASLFGGDSSALAMQFAASLFNGGRKTGGNPVDALLRAASGGGGGLPAGLNPQQMSAVAGIAGSLLGKQSARGGSASRGSDRSMASILSMLGLGGDESVTSQGAPPYRPTHGKLGEDKGILVTGCGPAETSADVRPKGKKAHGALTVGCKELHSIQG